MNGRFLIAPARSCRLGPRPGQSGTAQLSHYGFFKGVPAEGDMAARKYRAGVLTAFALAFGLFSSAHAADDRYVVVATHAPGVSHYVLKSEIEAVFDSNPSKCGLILTNAKLIRANEPCASIIKALNRDDFATFTNSFGKVFVDPTFVTNLIGANNGGCRLSLKNGRYVSVNEACAQVHEKVSME
jgi:hypothetical protein